MSIVRKYSYMSDWDEGPVEVREFFDTNDPYSLIVEAKQARTMLAKNFIQGHEFEDDNGKAIKAFDNPNVKRVCAIGAVYYTQGHQYAECNLITALNESAETLFPTDQEPCSCGCGALGHRSVVSVNDELGLDSTLAVFDHRIAAYQAEIDLAEEYAATYQISEAAITRWESSFNPSKPIIGAATQPIVKKEVNALHVS
jgi:hypothetical protein